MASPDKVGATFIRVGGGTPQTEHLDVFDGDLWVGVLHCCDLTLGPGIFEEVDAEMRDHMHACPNPIISRPGESA